MNPHAGVRFVDRSIESKRLACGLASFAFVEAKSREYNVERRAVVRYYPPTRRRPRHCSRPLAGFIIKSTNEGALPIFLPASTMVEYEPF